MRSSKHRHTPPSCWKGCTQIALDHILFKYNKLPNDQRSKLTLLELIQKHWNKDTTIYDSEIHYYLTLAQMTNHLLYLIDRVERYRDHVTWLSYGGAECFLIKKGDLSSYQIVKYTVDDDPTTLKASVEVMLAAGQHYTGILPKKIEIYSLLEGKENIYYPNIRTFTNDNKSFT